ncbi:MAG: hypothetical protein AB2693_27295 [Candidatus Thiodiazotropha sp.]
MAEKIRIVKRVFNIPEWYQISEFELEKLVGYIKEAASVQEAQWYRFLDCTTFCIEEKCFFCGEFARQQPRQ